MDIKLECIIKRRIKNRNFYARTQTKNQPNAPARSLSSG